MGAGLNRCVLKGKNESELAQLGECPTGPWRLLCCQGQALHPSSSCSLPVSAQYNPDTISLITLGNEMAVKDCTVKQQIQAVGLCSAP